MSRECRSVLYQLKKGRHDGVYTGDLTSFFFFGDFMLWEMAISCLEKHGISMIVFFFFY